MSRYAQYVEKHRQLILQAERDLWKMPETGYREWKTHAYLEEAYAKLGYELTLAGDIPGFTAEVANWIPCFAAPIRRRIPRPALCMPAVTMPRARRCWAWRRR